MENQNPYAAPAEMGLEDEPDNWVPPPPNPIASADERATAQIIDGILLGVIFLILGALSPNDVFVIFICFPATAVLGFVYYYFFELKFGRTIGKALAGTKVLSVAGEEPTSQQILKRTIARLNPIDVFSFLGEQGHPIGLHDSLSDTVVVADKRWTGNCTWLHFDGHAGFADTAGSSAEKYQTLEPREP